MKQIKFEDTLRLIKKYNLNFIDSKNIKSECDLNQLKFPIVMKVASEEIVHKSDYDFSLFLENIDKVKNVVNECGSDNICWEEKAEFYWEEDNKVFKFELISGKIADAFGEKEVMLSAAVDFNDINLLAGDEFKCSD